MDVESLIEKLNEEQSARNAKRKADADQRQKWLNGIRRYREAAGRIERATDGTKLREDIELCIDTAKALEAIGDPPVNQLLSSTPYSRLREYCAEWPPISASSSPLAPFVGALMRARIEQDEDAFRRLCERVFAVNESDQRAIKEMTAAYLVSGIDRKPPDLPAPVDTTPTKKPKNSKPTWEPTRPKQDEVLTPTMSRTKFAELIGATLEWVNKALQDGSLPAFKESERKYQFPLNRIPVDRRQEFSPPKSD